MTIRGGSSLGASGSVSANGFTCLGSETVALSLHHETYGRVGKFKTNGYEMLTPLWLFDLEPAWTHDLTFEHKKFKCACMDSKYPQNVRTVGFHGHLRF